MKRNRVLDYLVYMLIRAVICLVQTISLEAGQSTARQLAWLFTEVLRIRRKVADENLRHAFPELSGAERRQLIRRMWEHLFVLVMEVAHAPRKVHATNWRRFFRLKNVDQVVQLLLGNRPIVMVTAHFGNFEVGGFMLGMLGFPTFTVARNLDNPYLDRFVRGFRAQQASSSSPRTEGMARFSMCSVGGTMSFLADQYAGPKGAWVQFFGRPASAHKAIALFALEHDCAHCDLRCATVGAPASIRVGVHVPAGPADAPRTSGQSRR